MRATTGRLWGLCSRYDLAAASFSDARQNAIAVFAASTGSASFN